MHSDRRGGNHGDRRGEFKFQGLTSEELRRRREETNVEIRKNKREDSLNKRRNLVPGPAPSVEQQAVEPNISDDEVSVLPEALPAMVQGVHSADLETILRCVTGFRKLLSKRTHPCAHIIVERNPPIAEVVGAGVVPRFVALLRGGEVDSVLNPVEASLVRKIQFEAAWVLTNIASGTSDQTRTVIECNAVAAFVEKLVKNEDSELTEQCVWALGNIAGDSPQCRDFVLASDILAPLLTIMHSEISSTGPKISLLRNATWTLSNMCRGKPAPSYDQVVAALPILVLLLQANDDEILADACWSFSFLSDGSPKNINGILESGALPHLVRLLGHLIQTPALRAVGNIVTGDDQQTQVLPSVRLTFKAVIDAGALQQLKLLLRHSRTGLKKEACWAISNVTAGTPSQIQAVLEAGILPDLLQLLATADFKVRKEACWAVCNATSVYDQFPQLVRYIVEQNAIPPLCSILNCNDNKIILVALDGLENILKAGAVEFVGAENDVNSYSILIEECHGLDQIFALQNSESEAVYERSKSIIDAYFGGDDESDNFDLNQPVFGMEDNRSNTNSSNYSF